MKNNRCFLLSPLLFVGLFCAFASAADEPKPVFKAGAYAMDITPEFPISMNGGMTDRTAKLAHDRLHARCLVLDDGRTQLAITVCDSCAIGREIFDEAKRRASEATGIPTTNMLCSSTHTHTAPTATAAFQSEPDKGYQEFLTQKIAEGITQAFKQREPARIGWAIGSDPTQVFNRRWYMRPGGIVADPFGRLNDTVRMNPPAGDASLLKPAGPTDPEIPVVAVQSTQGRPIAVLANYSLHYVGGVPPEGVSADYYGAFAEEIKRLVGGTGTEPAFVGIMSNGTSGDVNNVNFFRGREAKAPFEQIRLVANSVATNAYDAYQRIVYHDWVPLAAAQRELQLGVRLPTDADIAQAKEILAQAGDTLKTVNQFYARETVLLAKYPKTVSSIVQTFRIGELGIAAIPCEVFVEIGLRLKKESPLRPTFTIELANGYNGYLPTPEHHKLGGYETWRARSSYLEENASVAIEEAVLELFKTVAPEGK